MTDGVSRFVQYFGEVIEEVASLQPEKNLRSHKKLLYVAILDGLAKAAFPDECGNKKRFVSLLKQFSGWQYSTKVSLPHLVRMLSKKDDPIFSRLREFVEAELEEWSEGDFVLLARDPDYERVKDLWPSEQKSNKCRQRLTTESLQHSRLLYSFRNSLVHEFRQPGLPLESHDNTCPYYISVGETSIWALVYPVRFFEHLCRQSLDKLESHFRQRKEDPTKAFKFGPFYIEELNE